MVKLTRELPLFCTDARSLEKLETPVHLGSLDHITQNFTPITVVFVYRQEEEDLQDELIPIERFHRALETLLDYYPHLAGRIVMSEDNSPRIERLDAGAKLVVAECDEKLDAFNAIGEDGGSPRLIVTNLPDGGNALLPPFDPSEAGMTRDPILNVQHTRFACGGVVIGCCLRHIVCDAAGFFQLVQDLAELYRGSLNDREPFKLSKPPHIHSYKAELHNMTPKERQEALSVEPVGFELSPQIATSVPAEDKPTPPPVQGRVLRFSFRELALLKAEANSTNQSKPFSTFCALAAHIWQSVHRARVAMVDDATALRPQLLLPVNLRTRNQLTGIQSRYFPNAVFSAVVSASAAQVLDAPLSAVAAMIHDNVQPQEPTDMLEALKWIAAQPDKRRVQACYDYSKKKRVCDSMEQI
ncbi:hypothetical protein V7S43_014519 [Phytophthora oleae]|uniref:Uncharacterized protein n=1 Tax=Phytophthora oleae TaxID=2107226 RepID=A0ABD3F1K7_9STRA